MDTKLRSFQVENMAKYEKFREIQQGRNKKIGQRLNELIEKEVKEAERKREDKNERIKAESRIIKSMYIYLNGILTIKY